jgi:ribosomal protein S18 acetylase RimI-like enzyme
VPRPYDRRELSKLCERRTGFALANTLDPLFDDERAVYGTLAADVERISGMGIIQVLDGSRVENHLVVATDGYPLGEVNGVLRAGVVHEVWEDRGIGTELMRLRVAFIGEAHNCNAVFGVAWCRPHTADSSALFEKFGFERLDTAERYYRKTGGTRECCPNHWQEVDTGRGTDEPKPSASTDWLTVRRRPYRRNPTVGRTIISL